MKEILLSNGDKFFLVDEYKGKQMRKLYAFRIDASTEGFDFYDNFDRALRIILDRAIDKDGKEIVVTMEYLDNLPDMDFKKLNDEVNSFFSLMERRLTEEVLKNTSDGNTE